MKAPCPTITDFPVQFPDEIRNFPVRGRREFSRKTLSDAARTTLAAQCVRPRGDAGLTRPARSAGTVRRQHLLRSRSGFLAGGAASTYLDRMKLPRAILFDLDDTILVAFGPAQ